MSKNIDFIPNFVSFPFLMGDAQYQLFPILYRTSQNGGLWDTGIEIFGRLIMKKIIKAKTIKGLLTMIEQERRGEQIDRSLLRSLVQMLSLGLFLGDRLFLLYLYYINIVYLVLQTCMYMSLTLLVPETTLKSSSQKKIFVSLLNTVQIIWISWAH